MRMQIMWIAVVVLLCSGSFSSLFGPPPGPGGGGGILSEAEKKNRIEAFQNSALIVEDGFFNFKRADDFDSIQDIDDVAKKLDAVLSPGLLNRTQFFDGAQALRDALRSRRQELERQAEQQAEQEERDADPKLLMEDLTQLVKDVQEIVSEKYQSETVERLEKELSALKTRYEAKEAELFPLQKEQKTVSNFIEASKDIETEVEDIGVRFLRIERGTGK